MGNMGRPVGPSPGKAGVCQRVVDQVGEQVFQEKREEKRSVGLAGVSSRINAFQLPAPQIHVSKSLSRSNKSCCCPHNVCKLHLGFQEVCARTLFSMGAYSQSRCIAKSIVITKAQGYVVKMFYILLPLFIYSIRTSEHAGLEHMPW